MILQYAIYKGLAMQKFHLNERERESSSRLICHTTTFCHTERSEVSKNTNANLQNPLDISVFAKPQYDKVNGQQYDNVVSFVGGNPISSPSIVGGNSTYSPSRSTSVARGWVDTTSASQAKLATASNANISVIASKSQDLRGNP